MTNQRRQLAIRGVIFAVLVVLLFFFSRYIPRPLTVFVPEQDFDDFDGIYQSKDKLSEFLQHLGPYSPAVFVLLQVLQVIAAPFPGELTGVAGGFVYGETFGFVLSTVGLSLGSWVAFELASILGRPFVERFVRAEVLQKFNFLTTRTGTLICFVLFLFPGFPKDYLCYVLGLSRMNLSTFLMVSIIGRLPGTYLLTMQGATIRNEEYHTFVFIAVLSLGVVAIAYFYRNQIFEWIRRRHDDKDDG